VWWRFLVWIVICWILGTLLVGIVNPTAEGTAKLLFLCPFILFGFQDRFTRNPRIIIGMPLYSRGCRQLTFWGIPLGQAKPDLPEFRLTIHSEPRADNFRYPLFPTVIRKFMLFL
jgi:hypothetical protein